MYNLNIKSNKKQRAEYDWSQVSGPRVQSEMKQKRDLRGVRIREETWVVS